MIDTKIILFVAQATSAITSLVGLIVLFYIAKVVKHLAKDSFRKIFSSLAIFFLVTLVGVISMATYHLLYGTGFEEFEENMEKAWYIFMFASILISCYGSYLVIEFGKSINKVKDMAAKVMKKEKKKKSLKSRIT